MYGVCCFANVFLQVIYESVGPSRKHAMSEIVESHLLDRYISNESGVSGISQASRGMFPTLMRCVSDSVGKD